MSKYLYMFLNKSGTKTSRKLLGIIVNNLAMIGWMAWTIYIIIIFFTKSLKKKKKNWDNS